MIDMQYAIQVVEKNVSLIIIVVIKSMPLRELPTRRQ